MKTLMLAAMAVVSLTAAHGAQPPAPRASGPIDVAVTEGTSMSVAVSPDGRMLATDLQGSIWTMPAGGGAMTRITDPFNDARQPMLFEDDPALKRDPRFTLYPGWMQRRVAAQPNAPGPSGGVDPTGGHGKMVLDIMKAGGLVVAGTDTPNGINLHGELMSYRLAGMAPFDILKTATVNPAQALGLEAGTIEAGKLADIIMIDGDPLENIANTTKVRKVMANGRMHDVEQLVAPKR